MLFTALVPVVLAALALAAVPLADPSVQIHPTLFHTKCIDVKGEKPFDGAQVVIWDCNGSPTQQWVLQRGDTKVRLANTNFCLDAGGPDPKNFDHMKIWTCYANLPAQAWQYFGGNNIKFKGNNQCLDLTGGKPDNGNPIQTYQCTPRDTNQIWDAPPVAHSQDLDMETFRVQEDKSSSCS